MPKHGSRINLTMFQIDVAPQASDCSTVSGLITKNRGPRGTGGRGGGGVRGGDRRRAKGENNVRIIRAPCLPKSGGEGGTKCPGYGWDAPRARKNLEFAICALWPFGVGKQRLPSMPERAALPLVWVSSCAFRRACVSCSFEAPSCDLCVHGKYMAPAQIQYWATALEPVRHAGTANGECPDRSLSALLLSPSQVLSNCGSGFVSSHPAAPHGQDEPDCCAPWRGHARHCNATTRDNT